MKVLLACAAFHPRGLGGGPEASYLIAKSLIERGDEVRVVTVGDEDAVEDYRGVAVHVVRSPNVYWNYLRARNGPFAKAIWHLLEGFNPRAYVRMRRQVKDFGPDVLMTVSIENINVATWLLGRTFRIPVVHVLHSYFLMCWRGSLFRNGRKCETRCADCRCISMPKKAMSRFVDGVFGESRFVLDQHVRDGYFPNALHDVIPSGLPSALPHEPRRRQGPMVVGYMGVLAPHKGVDTLGRAAALLTNDDIRFEIAGTGDAQYTETLRATFGEARVDFLGWVDAATTYPRFDVLVVPSRWNEPFGRIVIEAMAFGIPVVCSDSGGANESIVDGVSGFVFATDDVAMLADRLRHLARDESRRLAMGEAAAVASRRFDLTRVADEMQTFIRSVSRHGRFSRDATAPTPPVVRGPHA